MVENPANAINTEAAQQAMQAELGSDRLRELTEKGLHDPTSLEASEIKEICTALASHHAGRSTT